jgi:hypothetical protein
MTSASASRVTRSSRSLRLTILLFAGVVAGVTVLRAQETPPAAPPTERTAPAQATPTGPTAAGTQGEPPADAPAGQSAPPASKGPTPSRFEPTEKVRADFDVSFPIDI